MRATIFSFFLFLSLQQTLAAGNSFAVQDSIKRPGKSRLAADSTGHFLHINRIFIVGNRVTKERIILRELTLKAGDIVYSTELPIILEMDKKKLINTRLFNTVEIRMLEFQPDQMDLLIDLN